MTVRHRVVWSQGLFLQPHHFQQETRYLEHLIDARQRAAGPHAWGFHELVLDEAQLATGHVALVRASGVLPDGTPFSMPDADALPAPLPVPAALQGELVCLVAPRARFGVTEVDFGTGASDNLARYRVFEQPLRDQTNAVDDPETVQLGAVRLQLLRQRDVVDDHAVLGVVRVQERRADGQVVLDGGYLPAQTRIDASGQLQRTAALLHGLVQQRVRALADGMGQLGHGVSDISNFLALQMLNRAEPLLRQIAAAPSVHPWPVYLAWLQLAGEMATFNTPQRHPPDFPIYRHDDLQATFAPLVLLLREMLSVQIDRPAERIELVDRTHGVRTAVVHNTQLLRTAGFVLAVRANMPGEQLRQRFPNQTTVSSGERLKALVNSHLPGIALRSMAVAPRQLPFHADSHYFELERHGELWKQFEQSAALAMHIDGDFPGLELELWAIKQA